MHKRTWEKANTKIWDEDDEYRYFAVCLKCGVDESEVVKSTEISKPADDKIKPNCAYCKTDMKVIRVWKGKSTTFNIKKNN